MIESINLEKSFGGIRAVNKVSLRIREQEVFGLIGTNGAGKSTLLRMMAGVLRPDAGTVCIDNLPVYDNPEAKKRLFFIPDEPYFFPNSTAVDMRKYYEGVYESFDAARFDRYLKDFGLEAGRKVNHYSKGMKKQLAVILGVCAGTKYLFCDETFDGLDPVMRQGVKSIFARDMEERGLTPVIASHNLRELEDICDHVGLLHQGGVLLSEDIESMKLGIQKVQCVFRTEEDARVAADGLQVMNHEVRGRLHTFTVRGSREETGARFAAVGTVFYEILPLTLEEIFISETEVVGYDVKKFILG
ncbi:MAG: ABC transporter ATP-binding protein [Eubacteriales bacterium]|nr:ABC transporter ATP-binding protein [Eubacteriales bacterium]